MGVVLKAEGRLEEALLAFGSALELQPRSIETYLERGTMLGEHGQHVGALRDIDKALELATNAERAVVARISTPKVLALAEAGLYAEAEELLERSTEMIESTRLRAHLHKMRDGSRKRDH